MANEKILVVDDDANICELLRLYLTKEGYQVTVANDGEEGLEKFNAVKPDMVLLDVMMPKMDGLEVCRRIRKLGNTPVMMLTAKGETFDKVLGLELGADDYMVKPFDTKEVVARIKAVLRRCTVTTSQTESSEGVIEFDNLRLDMNSYELRVKGKVVEAPPKELELLNCLASHPNRVYTRDQLLVALDFLKPATVREGVKWLPEKQLDVFFVTLNKADKDYSPSTMYKDYSINESLFHWQSQSTTAENSATGQRYIHHREKGSRVLLFVREFKADARFGGAGAYTYLGTVNYVKHEGSRPMNITWKLDRPIPAKFLKKTNKLIVG